MFSSAVRKWFLQGVLLLSLIYTALAMESNDVERLTTVRVSLSELVGTEAETVGNIMQLYNSNFDHSDDHLIKGHFLSDYLSKCSKIEVGFAVFTMLKVSSALILRAVITARFRNARHYKRAHDIFTKDDVDHQMIHFCMDNLLELGSKDRSTSRFDEIIKLLVTRQDYELLQKFIEAGYPKFEDLYELLAKIFKHPSFEVGTFKEYCGHGVLHENFVMLAVLEAGRDDLACAGLDLGLKFPRRSRICLYEVRNEIETKISAKVSEISRAIAFSRLAESAATVLMASSSDLGSSLSSLPKELISHHICRMMFDVLAKEIFHDMIAPEYHDSM